MIGKINTFLLIVVLALQGWILYRDQQNGTSKRFIPLRGNTENIAFDTLRGERCWMKLTPADFMKADEQDKKLPLCSSLVKK